MRNEPPRISDGDAYGEVFGYLTRGDGDYEPVPVLAVQLNPENIFAGWRRIEPGERRE